MKTCSVRSKCRDQYQSDNLETNDELNPLINFQTKNKKDDEKVPKYSV